MTSLLIGFIGMVLIPVLIMSLVMSWWTKPKTDRGLQEENLRFTISSNTRS